MISWKYQEIPMKTIKLIWKILELLKNTQESKKTHKNCPGGGDCSKCVAKTLWHTSCTTPWDTIATPQIFTLGISTIINNSCSCAFFFQLLYQNTISSYLPNTHEYDRIVIMTWKGYNTYWTVRYSMFVALVVQFAQMTVLPLHVSSVVNDISVGLLRF